jgi:hypothetical protein
VQVGAAHNAAHEQRPLGASQQPAGIAVAVREPGEDVVERPDRATEERGPPREQLALDPVDVRPVGHDENWLREAAGVERIEIPAKQQLDLARVGGPRDETQRHPPTLARRRDGLYAAVADFGLRPRRAAARPGILPEQLSQRSACFAPRRASLYVTRITAPLPSSTSLPQLSHTRTVLRATIPSSAFRNDVRHPIQS